MLPELVETAVFPRQKDQRRAALARTLLTQLQESNTMDVRRKDSKAKAAPSNASKFGHEGGKRRKSRSRRR
jgi:hypothetical protein